MLPRLVICLLACLLVGCSKTASPVEVMDYGTYSAVIVTEGNWKLGREVRIASVGELEHQTTTTRIPAHNGVYWGFRAKVTNPHSDQAVKVTLKTLHPAITSPDGKKSTEDSEETLLRPNESGEIHALWFFIDASPFEYVPGTWTCEVELDGKPVYSQNFQVFKP